MTGEPNKSFEESAKLILSRYRYMFTNNWRKMHGFPKSRRQGKIFWWFLYRMFSKRIYRAIHELVINTRVEILSYYGRGGDRYEEVQTSQFPVWCIYDIHNRRIVAYLGIY